MRLEKLITSILAFQGVRALNFSSNVEENSLDQNQAMNKAIAIGDGFDKHPANHNPFFTYLGEVTEKGINPQQFEFLSANYEYRTAGTFFSVMQNALRIARKGDYDLLPLVMRNAAEEGGAIDNKAHLSLLEKAFDKLGERVFGVPPMKVIDAEKSPHIIDEARSFRQKQDDLYHLSEQEIDNEEMTGRYLAHERAASKMLRSFENLFKAYEGYFSEEEYVEMTEYFRAHIHESEEELGVEDRHGSDALIIVASALYQNLNNQTIEDQIVKGGNEMLQAQDELWNAMKNRMEELGKAHETQAVPPRLKSRDTSDIPSTKVSAKDFKSVLEGAKVYSNEL
jgi:hypothetical protein